MTVFLRGLGEGSPPRGWGRRPLLLGRSRGRRGKPSSPVRDGPPGGYGVTGSERKRNCAAPTVLPRQKQVVGCVRCHAFARNARRTHPIPGSAPPKCGI